MDLHSAVVSNDTDAVRALLASGAALSTTDQDGHTPLEVARDPDIARLLISAGAPVSTKGETTPLHRAIQLGWTDVAEMLLERGADPGSRDRFGDLPQDLLPDGPSALRERMARRLRYNGRSAHLGLDEVAGGPQQTVVVRPRRAEALTTMYRGTVLVRWDLEPRIRPVEIMRVASRTELPGPVVSDSGSMLAFTDDKSVHLRPWAALRMVRGLPDVPTGDLAMSADGRLLAVGGDQHLWIVDPNAPAVLASDMDLDHGDWEGLGDERVTPRFSPDGHVLAVGNSMRGSWWLTVLDVTDDGRLKHRYDRRDPQPWSSEVSGAVRFSPDGEIIVMWVHPTAVVATVTATGEPAWRHELPSRSGALCFTGDGRTLAVGTDSGVSWLDAASGRPRGRETTFGAVHDLAYADHCGMLAATSTGLHRLLG
ncbi:ankyrin repeat domain-containing protein [Actinocrispum wychmicini]|uniref:ankyrin repeat domain-containing protein n=1 Tax=Actinocrispum wychmicini TaxID=1213861 RepID=UPI0014055302|nr:ankyrin repeat domain-containing protein [Actinocrispum wychmicini]